MQYEDSELALGPHFPSVRWLLWYLGALRDPAALPRVDLDAPLAPVFTEKFAPERFVAISSGIGPRIAELDVVRLHATETTVTVELGRESEVLWTVAATVEPHPPHRLVDLAFQPVPHPARTPGLPQLFESAPGPALGASPFVLVFTGVPGTGKSTIADEVGRRLSVPVFAIDWLLGALTPFRIAAAGPDGPWRIGYEQLTHLVYRQLQLGQSSIVDAPVEEQDIRERWMSMASSFGARLLVVECVCSDTAVHRSRLEGRSRDIPGWHQGGNWENVRARLERFEPWDHNRIVIDGVDSVDDNLRAVLGHLEADR